MAAFGLQGRGNELNGAGEREKDERREQGPRRPPDFGLLGLGEGRVFMEELSCKLTAGLYLKYIHSGYSLGVHASVVSDFL